MRFTAQYLNPKTFHTYYRTVWADSVNEAINAARRYSNKGYRLVSTVSYGD